ncbi:hypothetical protein D9619_009537 [Psilocybe cf. subviscida]|uniref:2Fe-2S ferredoxin-type domain-containing protein n=1 Tax=Psilocybe cf. subviscida TaxID=2480587 RepID=A0A8H5BLW9_9AGAR|nr:hypothetical protein D9619_009537 [Psilocybe cf. subviscida]
MFIPSSFFGFASFYAASELLDGLRPRLSHLESCACEASVACSTCHVILPEEFYDKLPEPDDDENDMLDMAFGLTDTSRLGCQVHVTRELDGITCTLPSATRNMFVDGKKASH